MEYTEYGYAIILMGEILLEFATEDELYEYFEEE